MTYHHLVVSRTGESNETSGPIGIEQARAFLAEHFGDEPAEVEFVGEGAWSRCFGFRRADDDLVIRFGAHLDDFHNDRYAHRFAGPDLPIPEVLEIGRAFGGHYALSTRVRGVPLEEVGARAWPALVPALASALEAMRLADLSATSGLGGWGGDGTAPEKSWSAHLLAVADDTPERRTYGWREKLAADAEHEAVFTRGYDLLTRVASDAIPRSLVHADLINRNVLVGEGAISGVFDWGCSLFGDHLYDLAWFEFWAPWYPQLDMRRLTGELERHWREAGYRPEDRQRRLLACHLHIGLDHLAYNAHLRDRTDLAATAERMRILVAESGASL